MTDPALSPRPSVAKRGIATWADVAGVLGAVFAALCCMGAPIILGVLATLGLTWLRRDAILWPLMFLSLAVALWGLQRERQRAGTVGPLTLATLGAGALVAGVVLMHGPLARVVIQTGSVMLVVATLWNFWLRRMRRSVSRLSGA